MFEEFMEKNIAEKVVNTETDNKNERIGLARLVHILGYNFVSLNRC